jgi:hypothetical protein
MRLVPAPSRHVLALLLSLTLSSVAFGGKAEDRAKARALFESGTAHYNLGEPTEALADFRAAYRIIPDAVFIFNIAQCLRRLNQPGQAADFYRTYRREAPDAPNRREVDRLIEEMDKAVAEQRAHQPPTGLESPKPAPSETPRPEAPPTVTTSHTAAVTATAPARPVPLHKKWWLWTGVGVVAVGVGLGVGLGIGLSKTSGTVFTPAAIP